MHIDKSVQVCWFILACVLEICFSNVTLPWPAAEIDAKIQAALLRLGQDISSCFRLSAKCPTPNPGFNKARRELCGHKAVFSTHRTRRLSGDHIGLHGNITWFMDSASLVITTVGITDTHIWSVFSYCHNNSKGASLWSKIPMCDCMIVELSPF